MKYLKTYKLFEKSTLTYLGVPEEVMQDIQKQFALSDDAQWRELKFKKDLRMELRRKDDNFFIAISENNIIVIFSVDNDLYVDNYKFYQEDDMGDEYWDKEDRIETTVTEINKNIPRNAKIYRLISGDWTYETRAKRRLKKSEEEFNEFTNTFKKEFANNFTRIIRRLYSGKASLIQNLIISNLLKVDKNISPEKAKEILTSNVNKAKQSEFYKEKGKEHDPYRLQLQYIRDNSLTIFNEYLISFEEDMSNKYDEFLNIPELCDRFGRDKIMTAFMYYLYSGKLMEL